MNTDETGRRYAALGRLVIGWASLERLIWLGLELLEQKAREKRLAGYFKIPADKLEPRMREEAVLFSTPKDRDEDKRPRVDFTSKLSRWRELNISLLKLDPVHVQRVADVIPAIEKLQPYRNCFVHGNWEKFPDRSWRLRYDARVTISTEEKPFQQEITLGFLQELCKSATPIDHALRLINARLNRWAQSCEWLASENTNSRI